MSEPEMLNEKAAAALLGLPPDTIRAWRRRNQGPPYYRMETAIRYAKHELVEWRDAGRVQPEPVPA